MKSLENTVTRMTGRSAEEIRRSPLPRLAGRTPEGFISTAQVNRRVDRALQLPDAEELKQLALVVGSLAGIIAVALFFWWAAGCPVMVSNN